MTTESHIQPSQKPFNLLESFALWSLIVITLLSAISAMLMSSYIRKHLLDRDATVSMEFVQTLNTVTDPSEYFSRHLALSKPLKRFFEQVAGLPDVLRVNMYDPTGRVIWSSEEPIQNEQLIDNDELARSLQGELVVEIFRNDEPEKIEHKLLTSQTGTFVEYYLPIRSRDGTRVIGVAELYKQPVALIAALKNGYLWIWSIALFGGLLLYTTLFWLVRSGNRVIESQQSALVEAERMATIGNMVASVAHGIRNPLASMRTSAELGTHESTGEVREYFLDIIGEVDRFDEWVRELLHFSGKRSDVDSTIDDLNSLITRSIESFGDRPERIGVELIRDFHSPLPIISGDGVLIEKVANTLISNALEAMPNGGKLIVSTQPTIRGVTMTVADNGVGMSDSVKKNLFTPMISNKSGGLGVGLVLAKRVIEGYGGSISIQSARKRGTQAKILLLRA